MPFPASGQCVFTQKTTQLKGFLPFIPVWFGSPSELRACYTATPFNSSVLAQTITVLKQALGFYTFKDIDKLSGPPYSIQIDVEAELNKIALNTYGSDYDMHLGIADAFISAQDNHLNYRLPQGYRNHYVVLPFLLSSEVQAGQQVFIATPGHLGMAFDNGTAQSTQMHWNKQVTKINDIPIFDFLSNFALRLGIKDDSSKLNALLSSSVDFGVFSLQPMSFFEPIDSYKWDFSDGTSTTINNLAISSATCANLAAFIAQNKPNAPFSPAPPTNTVPLNFSSNDFLFIKSTDNREVSYWNFRNGAAIVCWVRAFTLAGGKPIFDSLIQDMLNYANINGIKNLILDLSSDPGGEVRIAMQMAANLVKEWDGARIDGITNMYQTFDFVSSPFVDRLVGVGTGGTCNASRTCNSNEYCSVSGECLSCGAAGCVAFIEPRRFRSTAENIVFSDARFYSNKAQYTRGGVQGSYSQPVFYSFTGETAMETNPASPPFWFDKILIVTDGLCGSACAQFLHQLRVNEKVRVLSVGGILGKPMDTVAFPGGAVIDWGSLAPYSHVPQLPTNAYLQINWLEVYSDCASPAAGRPPREFQRVEGDARLLFWKKLNSDVYSGRPGALDNHVQLYDMVLPYFNQMLGKLASRDIILRPIGATNYCSNPQKPSVVFSANCIGSWVPIQGSQCTKPCNGGTQTQAYLISVPGIPSGTPCPTTDGDIQDRPCNVDPCINCVGDWVQDPAGCNVVCGEGQQKITFKVSVPAGPDGKPCNYTDGTVDYIPCIGKGISCNNTEPAPAGERYPVIPYFQCVETGVKPVVFLSYENRGKSTVNIPVQPDLKNFINPADGNSQLLTSFAPGTKRFAMAVSVTASTADCNYTIDGVVAFNTFSSQFLCPDSLQVLLRDLIAEPTAAEAEIIRNCILTITGILNSSLTITTASFGGSPRAILTFTSDPNGITAARILNKIAMMDNFMDRLKTCAKSVNLTGSAVQMPVPLLSGSNPGFVTNDQFEPQAPTWITVVIIVGAIVGVLVLVGVIVAVIISKKKKQQDKDNTNSYRRM